MLGLADGRVRDLLVKTTLDVAEISVRVLQSLLHARLPSDCDDGGSGRSCVRISGVEEFNTIFVSMRLQRIFTDPDVT